jgi:hypothetical protein
LRRVHGNLSERVLPLAADLDDLDEPIERAPNSLAELSPVGGPH